MSEFDYEQWLDQNNAYLAAALAWLRLRLRRLIQHETPLVLVSAPAPPPAPLRRRWWLGERDAPAPAAPLLLPAPAEQVSEEQIKAAFEAMNQATLDEPPPALLLLARRFQLSEFEQHVLLLCAAMEFDPDMALLCAKVHNDPAKSYPTFALALLLFDAAAWDIVSPERPLRYWRLIEINQPGAQPLTSSALRADERIVNYLKGLDYIDDRIAPLLAPLDARPENVALPPSQFASVEQIVRQIQQRTPGQRVPTIQMIGTDSSSKQMIAAATAAFFNLVPYRLTIDLLPSQPADLEIFTRLWQRESLLQPLALYLDAAALESGDQTTARVRRFVQRHHALCFVDVRDAILRSADTITVDIAKPITGEQQDAWRQVLPAGSDELAAHLAAQFSLNLPTIERIATMSQATAPAAPAKLRDQVWAASRASLRPQLDALAERIEAKATWADLVVPKDEEQSLRQIVNQVRQRQRVYQEWGFAERMNRGLGINALFAGQSGTGKTMAAEVIANDLQLDLYRIDLSAVVSKYIGETEKNLRRVFDRVEDGGAILFFDEADALFGKRSEVKDSHDRYANIEINYLLQRMEAYRGLAILATNMRSALDPAFLRRLRFIVTFPFPSPRERKQMWQKVFPDQVPAAELDHDRLARLSLTGGNIHTVALNAAFMAATDGAQVTMGHILHAARDEYRKLERPINEAEFADPRGTQ